MAVYSFSIKEARTDDLFEVGKLKSYCVKHGINFSDEVVKAIKLYNKANDDKRRT